MFHFNISVHASAAYNKLHRVDFGEDVEEVSLWLGPCTSTLSALGLQLSRVLGWLQAAWSGSRQESPFWTLDLLEPVRENRDLKHFPYYFLKSNYPRYAGNSELSSLQMRRENKHEHVCFDHMKRSLIWRRLSSSSETVLQCIVLNEEGTAHFFVEIPCCSINPAVLLWENDASAGYFQCASTC